MTTFTEWLSTYGGETVRRSTACAETGDDAGFRRAVRSGLVVRVAKDLYVPTVATPTVDLLRRAGSLTEAFGAVVSQHVGGAAARGDDAAVLPGDPPDP